MSKDITCYTKLFYTKQQKEIDDKFKKYKKLVEEYVEDDNKLKALYDKGLINVTIYGLDNKDKKYLKLLKIARKEGWLLFDWEGSYSFTAMTHKRQIKQFSPGVYDKNQSSRNGICLKDLGYEGCYKIYKNTFENVLYRCAKCSKCDCDIYRENSNKDN